MLSSKLVTITAEQRAGSSLFDFASASASSAVCACGNVNLSGAERRAATSTFDLADCCFAMVPRKANYVCDADGDVFIFRLRALFSTRNSSRLPESMSAAAMRLSDVCATLIAALEKLESGTG